MHACPAARDSDGLCYFLHDHLGYSIPSPALFKPLHGRFVTAVDRFVATHHVPVVWVLATGGTIAGQGSSSASLAECKSGSLRGEEFVDGVPEIRQSARVKIEQMANLGSSDLTIEHWLTLASRINAIVATDPRVAGVVVTHGTDTQEETACFLNLAVRHDRPVVVVGSTRPASAISADRPRLHLRAAEHGRSSGARVGRCPGSRIRRQRRRIGPAHPTGRARRAHGIAPPGQKTRHRPLQPDGQRSCDLRR